MATKSITHFIASSKNSLRGLVSTFKNETAFRQEAALVVPHVVILWLVHFPLWANLLLSVLLAVVFIAELLNTGIECVVDIASPRYHELAKRAKDAASAAVGLSLLVYFLSWIVLFVEYGHRTFEHSNIQTFKYSDLSSLTSLTE